jgi:hypothetical protein
VTENTKVGRRKKRNIRKRQNKTPPAKLKKRQIFTFVGFEGFVRNLF